jgi:hypothetical protein
MPSDKQQLAAAREAIDKLSSRYSSPRRLEAALDKVESALRELPNTLTKIASDVRPGSLCDLLSKYARIRGLDPDAVVSCRDLIDLAELADYEIGDEEDFANATEGKLEVLKAALEDFLEKLDDDARH